MIRHLRRANAIVIFYATAACRIIDSNSPPPTSPSPTPPPPTPPVDTRVGVIWTTGGEIFRLPAPDDVVLLPSAINDSGEVAGILTDRRVSGSSEIFVWTKASGIKRSGRPVDVDGQFIVTGISASGTVIGYITRSSSYPRAFAWTSRLGFAPPTGEAFTPTGINDAGTIVGNGPVGPVTWTEKSGMKRLALTSDLCTQTTAINNADEIIGWGGDELGGFGCYPQRWIVWRTDTEWEEFTMCPRGCDFNFQSLNDQGVAVGNYEGIAYRMRTRAPSRSQAADHFSATDINNAGDVSGRNVTVPSIWRADDSRTNLALLSGYTKGWATAINNRGEAAGTIEK